MKRYSFTVTFTVPDGFIDEITDEAIDAHGNFIMAIDDIFYEKYKDDMLAEVLPASGGNSIYLNCMSIPAETLAEATKQVEEASRPFIEKHHRISEIKFDDIEIEE